ncbi:MAG: hypothetical protein M0Z54_02930 [Thermaerobacter sp.]|nr:hypothetical protein [Thermaerobacter sp.]
MGQGTRRPTAVMTAMMASLLLGGCGSTTAGATPLGTPPRSTPSDHRTALPLGFSLMAAGSSAGGWALPSAGALEMRDGGAEWVGNGPPGLPGVGLGPPLSGSGQVAGQGNATVAESFPAPNVAVVAVEKSNGTGVTVYETTDRGVHWARSTLPLSSSLASTMAGGSLQLQFVSARRGWVLLTSQGLAGSQMNVLLGTVDGGRHWQQLQTSRAPSGHAPLFEDVNAVVFRRGGSGIATINSPAFDSARVLTTNNGGVTWVAGQLPLPTTAHGTNAIEGAPSLSPTGVVWVPVTIPTSAASLELVLYATSDGGTHWTSRAWSTPLPLPTTVVLVGGQQLFLGNAQGTTEYGLGLSPTGQPTWRPRAVPQTASSTTAAWTSIAGGP